MGYREWREKIREYNKITKFGPICRRYFVIGAFDGALTILGLVIGAYFAGAGEDEVPLVVAAGLSASIALAMSSIAGAYEAERVEKKIDRQRMERALLARMSDEHLGAYRFAAWISAIVHGFAPLIAAIIPLVPFYVIPDFFMGTVVASVLGLSILFVIGVYLGRLVKEIGIVSGLRFLLVGLATAGIVVLLGAS